MTSLDEFVELVKKRLGASAVQVLSVERPELLAVAPQPAGEEPSEGESRAPSSVMIESVVARGRRVIAVFDSPEQPLSVLKGALDELVALFAEVLEPDRTVNEPTLEQTSLSLRQILVTLAQRASAEEVVVIDAHSPVVWGVAYGDPEPLEGGEVPLDNVRWLRAAGHPGEPDAAIRHVRGVELGVPVFDAVVMDPRLRKTLPDSVWKEPGVLPLFETEAGEVVLAMTDPTDLDAVHRIVLSTGRVVEPVLAPASLLRFVSAWEEHAAEQRVKRAKAVAVEHVGVDKTVPTEGVAKASAAEASDGADAGPEGVAKASAAEASDGADAGQEVRAQRAEDTVRMLASRYVAREAIRAVRALPEIPTLRKGGHVNRTIALAHHNAIARSFGTIYVLVVVVPERFNELQTKHAIVQALPVIEDLVVSLPPRTPLGPKGAGARAVRRRQ